MSIEITMPALSPTMEEGILAKWHVKEGDKVESGMVLAEIETDKATMEVEAVDEGVIGKILVAEGTENVKVNAVIAILLEEGEDASAMDKPAAAPAADAPSVPDQVRDTSPASGGGQKAAPASSSPTRGGSGHEVADGGDRLKASPLAKRIAADKGLDLAAIKGSGPHGRIVKRDVENAQPGAAKPASAPAAAPVEIDHDAPLARYGIAADRYDVVKADGITKIAAKRLSESFRDIPHFPLNVDCRIDALLDFRKRINEAAGEEVKVSVNDILIKAAGLALKKVPAANASWIEDGRIALHKHADVSMAVAIEGGLITPIIFDADTKGLVQISTESKDLAARARTRKLKPEEFQGGTFSLSNLGMFGIQSFSSIINPPQGMILSIGAGEQRPVVTNGALAIATVMTVTLTCDHRVVDGATGAKWIAAFRTFVEDPMTMLM
ncbi:pyruvate dehydrogenase complex dihydrolipoamide acetyltransferase [Maricaulis salignorans]|uniref:Acetyltransferase component of pyruvate dehydrogenase complex n=1 Tax=Maricaulis salignorans TaxID=144026 RepID=A0A1G9NXP1_9PROT|nr:pyruvate dehydrogenase complex dihydrolipoamide acetyltransferase [Maricaulis salignorans]SDL91053.1 pyruvate dehydrogenase E2 component (dihydrolipoamide acetyltransferase) [Maricaulis salignorans]